MHELTLIEGLDVSGRTKTLPHRLYLSSSPAASSASSLVAGWCTVARAHLKGE